MTLFASKRRTKGFVGRRGANRWAGWSNWSILNVASPEGTRGQMLVAPGSHQWHMGPCPFSSQVFFLFIFSFFLFLTLFHCLSHFTSFIPCIFSLLSAPSGGSNRNWWGYRGGGSDAKESACSVGGLGLIPGSGRSPGEGNGNPLQYSCLENSMGRGAWQVTVHGVARVRHKWATNTNTGAEFDG